MKRTLAALVLTVASCAALSPVEAQPLVVGRRCCTNAGSCLLPQYQLLGAICYCTGPWGVDNGQVCQ